MTLQLHIKLHEAVAVKKRRDSERHMPLKKQSFAPDEILIYDEAVVYKRGEYRRAPWFVGRRHLKTKSFEFQLVAKA